MKRSLNALLGDLFVGSETLSRDDMHRARRLCEAFFGRRYSEMAAPVTTAFFTALGHDVFLRMVLEPLARSERLQFIGSLRLVCLQWHALVVLVTHLNFGPADHSGTLYPMALSRFTRVTSIHAHRRILMSYNCNVVHIASVRELRISRLSRDEQAKYSYDATRWTSLTRLDFRDCDAPVKGLSQLTALRQLKITSSAFLGHSEDLLKLTQLHTLRLRNFVEEFDPSPLTALRHLKSDCALHFSLFTGSGVLEFDDDAQFDFEREARDAYHPQCWNAKFTGDWVAGVFSGTASYQYGDDCSDFYGQFVDGKREGPGEEVCETEHRQYTGVWRKGQRHGKFEVYNWEGFGARTYVLERVQRWEYGRLASDEKLLVQ